MILCRFVKLVFILALMVIKTAGAQDTYIGENKKVSIDSNSADLTRVFYKVTKKGRKNIFKKAVTEHIVSNKGIQDFYAVPSIETQWLNTILQSENKWHKQFQKRENDYRKAFQRRVGLNSGQNDMAVRIENHTKNIAKLEKEISEIRRQIVQINVDQQVYINSLRRIPITTLVAIQTLYTSDLMKIKNKLDVLNNAIFKSLEDPVLGHITANYSRNVKIPFKTGHVRVTYMYPENITLFDSKANEHVYLFLRVEGYPFSKGETSNVNANNRGIEVQIFSDLNQIKSYLNTKNVGDQRLLDWLNKEYNYQMISNEHILDTIRARLNDFKMFKNGLKKNIAELNSKALELESKRDLIISKGTVQSIEKEFKQAKEFYKSYFSKRQVLTHEKYTLENDVMFSLFHVEGEFKKNNGNTNTKQIVGSNVLANIPISGRPLKDIFADILYTAHKKRNLNLQNYRERIYRPNEGQTQLIQGELEWKIDSEEFSILKLTRGNVGSRSHFVVHLAKRTNLKSIPGFPAEKSGTCKATLLFKRGKNIMRNSSKPILNRLVKCLRNYPQQMIQITGHTDPLKPNYGEGSKYSNVTLGLKRAETMVKALINLKFNPGRFIVISRGAQMPVAIGKSNKALQKNRRVEIISKPSL